MKNRIEAEFPLTTKCTYLNTAASGLLPASVLAFRQEHDLEFFEQGSKLRLKHSELITLTREAVARLFNGKPSQIALVPSFSMGFNTLLDGVKSSSKFLLLKGDYPSVNWPVKSRNFETRYVDISAEMEDDIAEAFKVEQPDVFAFSIVQYISGIKMDLPFIKKLKKQYPETLFFADGTQYCGTENFNFSDSGIDVLGASPYKWLNAGYGNGFLMFKEQVTNHVFPNTTGFNSITGKHKQQDNNFIGKFEPGHQDTLNYGSLLKAIELVENFGMDTIENTIKELSLKARAMFEERGLLSNDVVNRKEHSSIFNIKGDDALYQKLEQNNIACAQRGDGIRVAFHYYNTEADLEKLLQLV